MLLLYKKTFSMIGFCFRALSENEKHFLMLLFSAGTTF
ncbi:conserved hypothetical protein (plasmid) [Borreliella burgdorferi WI91-23]|nr:conserved hypothetical protein [Borreliella burgdorferi 64b]ACN55709.1 conserved hypothetical protein [Borreliella burgdorferi WI91-23]